jgi:hypothetical protein
MKQTTRKRPLILIIIPILLLPMISIAYAHFTDTVTEKYKIHVTFTDIEITSYKILSKWDGCLIKKCIQGNTITIQTKVFPGWYAWIGLILHNKGCQPCEVQAPTYNVYDPNNVWKYFKHTEYFYGPYNHGEFATANPQVWGGIKYWQLPPEATPTPPPITLEYCHKLVLWIKLKFDPCGGYKSGPTSGYSCYCYNFKIKISITVGCTPELIEGSSWTWTPPS